MIYSLHDKFRVTSCLCFRISVNIPAFSIDIPWPVTIEIDDFQVVCDEVEMVEVCEEVLVSPAVTEEWTCSVQLSPGGPIGSTFKSPSDKTAGLVFCDRTRNASPAVFETVCRMVPK